MKKIKFSKKFVASILFVFFLGGVWVYFTAQKSAQTLNNLNLTQPDINFSKLTFSWAEIPELSTSILYPTDFPLAKEIPNPFGTIASYHFKREDASKWNFFFLSRLNFSDKNSIQKSVDGCSTSDSKTRCYAEASGAVDLYNNLKVGFSNGKGYGDYYFMVLGGQKYLIHEDKCEGDACTVRRYVTFKENTQITIQTIWFKDEASRNKLDAVISGMVIR